jgi:hypothetical protein
LCSLLVALKGSPVSCFLEIARLSSTATKFLVVFLLVMAFAQREEVLLARRMDLRSVCIFVL